MTTNSSELRPLRFRVREEGGLFWIEREIINSFVSGMLWWQRRNYYKLWRMADRKGRGMVYHDDGSAHPPCKTLEEAYQKIEQFNTEPKYHYPDVK